ncbi:hypothetical protein EVAR_18073_1 [Eumeta japonica]|uniref:Uncharacterized protein n=1 Tax=Eumeta variegata TaxID=151549 RepID=A0A4C1VJY7_EUMVA|nr:hypothetical protein EVAR_18073_1 [Eumeta japonica]
MILRERDPETDCSTIRYPMASPKRSASHRGFRDIRIVGEPARDPPATRRSAEAGSRPPTRKDYGDECGTPSERRSQINHPSLSSFSASNRRRAKGARCARGGPYRVLSYQMIINQR